MLLGGRLITRPKYRSLRDLTQLSQCVALLGSHQLRLWDSQQLHNAFVLKSRHALHLFKSICFEEKIIRSLHRKGR